MQIGKKYQLLFLWFVVLGVFYPAIFAGLNSVDDWKMFYSLDQTSRSDFWLFFLPTSGFYYRPLLMLSFVVDYRLWGGEPSFFHLVNILLHALNVSLVFLVSWQLPLASRNSDRHSCWPLVTALFFAVHPIVTESVDWISGRTDLLGSLFALLATLFLLIGIRRLRLAWVAFAMVALACAIMSKEVMVFFLPAAAFLLWRISVDQRMLWRLRAMSILIMPFVVSGVIYFCVRIWTHGAGSGFNGLLAKYDYSLFDTVRVFFKVLGFYLKKMIAPLPLNFAIVSAADAYVWLGIGVLLVIVFLLFVRRTGADLLIVSFMLILPGILIALTNVAWTPLAERYIYLPTVFFVLAAGSFLNAISQKYSVQKWVVAGCALLLFPMTVVTVQRNLVWQDNVLLYTDSVKKSPNFAAMNNELAVALIASGDLTQAENTLHRGKALRTATPLLYINQARIYLQRGELGKARKEMLKICEDKETANIEALKMLARIDERRIGSESFDLIAKDLIHTYRYLTKRGADPFYDYRLGQLLLLKDEKEAALQHFKVASTKSASDAHYKGAAQKFVKRLTAELSP